MSDAKQRILGRLRAALGERTESASSARKRLLAGATPRPQWELERLPRFLAQFERAAGTYRRIAAPAEMVAAVTDYLATIDAPTRLMLAPHPALEQEWPTQWELGRDAARAREFPVAMTVAVAGVAETGSLVLPASAHTPTGMNFLPDVHIVLLDAAAVVDYMEEAMAPLRAAGLPRTVNVVTGPSRTADVEQTIQLGAHGPRRLHLLLVG